MNSIESLKIDNFTATYNNNGYDIDINDNDFNGGLETFLEKFQTKDNIKTIYIYNNSINSIPINISLFTNLKRLIVTGTRLWSINLDNLPISLEYLCITGSNTSFEDLEELNRLENLEYLEFDNIEVCFSSEAFKPYNIDYNKEEETFNLILDPLQLPYLKSLKSIKIYNEPNSINLCVFKTFLKNFLYNYPNYKSIIGDNNSYSLSLDKNTDEIEEDIYEDIRSSFYIISL